MYRNILVPIEPSHGDSQRAAVEMATRLAEDSTATITALTVIEPPPPILLTEAPKDLQKHAGERAMCALRSIVGPQSEIGTVILHGRAATEILDYARKHGVDCIVIASHMPGIQDYFLGSTAARVVRHAPCAVHVMR